jgi:Fe-S cluster assembly protein SufD
MATTVDADKERYLSAFASLARDLAGDGRAWTGPLRRRAIDRFAEIGFPTGREEAWRFTSVAPLTRIPFRPAPAGPAPRVDPATLERLAFEPRDGCHLVFVNGVHAPELSRLRPLPGGVRAGSLAEALAADRDRVEPHLGRVAGDAAHAFAALNTAFLRDGSFVQVSRGVAVGEPIHLLYVSAPDGEPTVSYPRTLVVAEEGSRVTLVESYVGPGAGVYLTNAVTEIAAGEGAIVDHVKLQRESDGAFHVGLLQARLGRDTGFTSHVLTLGGGLVRNDTNAVLEGEGASAVLNGLYVTDGRQHVDNHTLIDHRSPRGVSRELYKGVLDGASRGVFDGTIIVRKDAQKTDAWQTNKNLLLSEEALVDTNPRLQILADDVKCKHGSTVGQLDEHAIFYLRSRGVGIEAARSLLIHAFVNDIIDRVAVAPLRAGLECVLFLRLPRHGGRVAT